MTKRILVAYGSRYGSTREVAETVADELRFDAHVDVWAAEDVLDVSGYDAIVVGAGIYIGRLHRSARAFLERHQVDLEETPFAVFALGPSKDRGADWESAQTALDKALEKLHLSPASQAIFGGVINPTALRFPFNHLPAADLRDWKEIRAWARSLPAALERDLVLTH